MKSNDLGRYICYLRTRAGYSQTKLAELVGATPFYISYLESGRKNNPSVKVMAGLFKALDMNKEEIEHFLDIHARANDCVSYDITDYIMENEDILKCIRNSRDEPDASPNWNDFINKINKV